MANAQSMFPMPEKASQLGVSIEALFSPRGAVLLENLPPSPILLSRLLSRPHTCNSGCLDTCWGSSCTNLKGSFACNVKVLLFVVADVHLTAWSCTASMHVIIIFMELTLLPNVLSFSTC